MCIRKDRKACIAPVVSTATKVSSHFHYADGKKKCKTPKNQNHTNKALKMKKIRQTSLSSSKSLLSKTSTQTYFA